MGVIHAYGLSFNAANMLVDEENKKITGVDATGNELIKFEGVSDTSAYTFNSNEVYVPVAEP